MNINRRFFLRASAMAGGGFMLALVANPEMKAQGFPGAGPALSPADFISIAPDGTATIVAKNQELGQGALNLLPMMIAEELEVDWEAVHIVRSGVGPQYGGQITGGSFATPSNWEPMPDRGGSAANDDRGCGAKLGVWRRKNVPPPPALFTTRRPTARSVMANLRRERQRCRYPRSRRSSSRTRGITRSSARALPALKRKRSSRAIRSSALM